MVGMARRAMCGLALTLALAGAAPLRAQNTTPPAPPSADPLYDSQKAAFEALPEADRKAIQDSLIWSGQYLGVVDGVFGKRTRDAIVAYQTSVKAPPDGLVGAAQLAVLTGAAQKARAAIRFQTFTDEKTGIKIAAPLKILDKRVVTDAGAVRLTKADGSAVLDLLSVAGADGKLGATFAALIADTPGRKITLKISRPDFFVVSGEEAGRKFYQRMAKAPVSAPDPAAIRGFRLVYPASDVAFDRIGVAIADSFEPFPSAAPAPPAGVAAAQPPAPPSPPPAPARPFFAATGLLVAQGQALTAIGESDCPNPTIDGKPAKFVRDDRELGLSLLSADLGGSSFGAPSFGAIGPDMIALSYSADEPSGRVTLNVTSASPLAAGQGDTHPSLLASFSKNARGAPVFDRMGGLAAMIAQAPGDPKLVAGVAPMAPHGAISAEQIQRFLAMAPDGSAKAAASPLGAGQLAAVKRSQVVAISCRR
jgi:peptidoglycan hydrolase-like protein with peptidoglycan-binding domain